MVSGVFVPARLFVRSRSPADVVAYLCMGWYIEMLLSSVLYGQGSESDEACFSHCCCRPRLSMSAGTQATLRGSVASFLVAIGALFWSIPVVAIQVG